MQSDTEKGKRREPSCVLNHDVMRRELRHKELASTPCPECGWVLEPARPDVHFEVVGSNVGPVLTADHLQHREVAAQESIAKSLENLLMQFEWFVQYMRGR